MRLLFAFSLLLTSFAQLDKRRQHTGPRYTGCVPVDYIPWDQVVSIGTIDLNIGLVPRECRKKCQDAGFAHFGLLTDDFAECFCGKPGLELGESDVFTEFRDCKRESLVIFTTSQFVQYENSPKQSDICVDLCASGEAGSLCTCDTQPPAKSLTMGPEEKVGMQINIETHHVDLTKSTQDYVHKKMEKLERFFEHINQAQVVLKQEKLLYIAEATLRVNQGEIHASSAEDSMYAAIDSMVDKLTHELNKHKEKMNYHGEARVGATEWICVDGLPQEEGTSLHGVGSPSGDSLQARKDACEAFPGCNSFARNVNKEWFPKSGFTMDDNNWRSNVSPDWSFCYMVDKHVQKATCSVDTWDGHLFQSQHPRSLNQNAEHGKTYKIIDFSNKLWYGTPVGLNWRPGVSSAVIKGEGCEISFKDKDGNVKCTLGPGSYDYAAFTPDCGNDVVVEYDVNVRETSLARQNQRLAHVNKALREALQTLQN